MAARGWYLAWIDDEAAPFDPVVHRRKDLGLKSVDLREEEGGEPVSVSIVTERMSTSDLVGRSWAILSFGMPDGTLFPMARMKRRPLPVSDTQGELKLDFACKPTDWQTRRDTVLQGLKVRPYFEPLLVSSTRQNDPVEILDGHRRVGHFDRVTHEYTTVEMLGVGVRRKVLQARDLVGWKNGGGVRWRRTQQPLAGVQVEFGADWTQADDGYVFASQAVAEAFQPGSIGDPTGTGPSGGKSVPGGVVTTLTPGDLERSFPKPGSALGGASGYTILEATLQRIPVPLGAPDKTGAMRGQKARYDYTSDADLQRPLNLGFDVAYYASTLVLAYSLRQRRTERVSVFVTNRNVAYADGTVESLALKCEDPTVDPDARPYLAGQNVSVGDVRRVGWYNWIAVRPHVTRGPFTQDLYAADGSEQWELMRNNGSPLGSVSASTLYTTPRGVRILTAGIHKALKRIALSQRSIEIRFVVPLEDWHDVSTAWAVELQGLSDKLLPGGTAWGKVTSVEISHDGLRDFPKAVVTMTAVDGGGLPGPDQITGVNPTGEVWDGVLLDNPLGTAVPPSPLPAVAVTVENPPGDQVAYVQARDWTGAPGRNDRTLNDPHHLLTEARTKLKISGVPIAGQPAIVTEIPLGCSAWSGPAQIQIPTV